MALIMYDQTDKIKNFYIEKQQTNIRLAKVLFPMSAVAVIILMSHKLAPRCGETGLTHWL
jgi:hypothetical protein